jgi:hypothetical protein
LARSRGEAARARALLERSLTLFEEVGDKLGVGYALYCLGRAAQAEGDAVQAIELLTDSARRRRQLGDRRGTIEALEALAEVAASIARDPAVQLLVAQLLGATEAQRRSIGAARTPVDQESADRARSALGRAGGDSAEAALRHGGTLSWPEIISLGFVLGRQLGRPSTGPPPAVATGPPSPAAAEVPVV